LPIDANNTIVDSIWCFRIHAYLDKHCLGVGFEDLDKHCLGVGFEDLALEAG
jgi:hypothetical protein